jgi:L-alanine-DL-glutamate epimerase-like enolase superfamily enzyme
MRVQSAVIDFVFPPPFPEPIADSTLGPFCDFPIGFLQVHCEGIVGYGVVPVSQSARSLTEEVFFPLLWECEIEDVSSVESFWSLAWKRIRNMGPGLTLSVLSGIDAALWDIISKRANQPLYRMLGGTRNRIACYATNGWVNYNLPRLISELEKTVARGFQTIKMKVGVNQGTLMEEDVRRVKAVRRALGESIKIAVDGNQCWTVEEALQFARAIADENILWFEEPIPAHDFFGYQRLVKESPIPIAAGESLYEDLEYLTFLKLTGVAIVQPYACTVGGITPFRRAVRIAADAGTRLTTGDFSPMTCSLVAAAPTGFLTEYAIPALDTFTPLLQQQPEVVNGEFHLLETPGHGMVPDFEMAKKYSRGAPLRLKPGVPVAIQVF